MKIAILVRFLQAGLCPAFVFGWWLFPRLGISGVSLSNTITFGLGMSLGFFYLFSGKSRLKLTLKGFRIDPGMVWRIVKIGIPASIMGIQSNFGWTLLMKILAPFGTVAVAGQALVGRLEMAVHLPPAAIGSGAGVLVGQNLGAGQPARAVKSGWLAAAFAEGFIVLASLVPLLWGEDIIRAFNPDPGLVEIGGAFFKISVIGYMVMGLTFALQPSISSAGDTLPPMFVSIVMMWASLIPLALLLSGMTDLGVYGVRWAISISWVVEAIAYTIYFSLGRWKRKKV
jgi:Na+-driven multidrug efflux pump